ncbi:MAG: hypothetical protein AB7P18_30845 [Candidatus Binatia bacterium]
MRIEIHPKPDGMQHINLMFCEEEPEPEDILVQERIRGFPVPPKRTLQWERDGRQYTVLQYGQCVIGNVMFYIEKHKGVVDKIQTVCQNDFARVNLPRAVFNELVSQIALEFQQEARFAVDSNGELGIAVDENKLREYVQRKLAETRDIVQNGADCEP